MQSLFQLIHSLAKEEKRLYNLHGRKARFVKIYEGYLQASRYEKELDRQIFQEHFSQFSKAFYSMQKNALMDDVLAVLLEYSNSSRDEYQLTKLKSKYEILVHKEFYDLALHYLRNALESAKKIDSPTAHMRVLEDYANVLAKCESAKWEEYEGILQEINQLQESLDSSKGVAESREKLQVLLKSTSNNPSEIEKYKLLSLNIIDDLKELLELNPNPELEMEIFESEYLFSKTYEDELALHKRLIFYENKSRMDNLPLSNRLRIINLLLESSLECGDFLLLNSLIYKTQREIRGVDEETLAPFMPKFLELSGIYHFYENDITQSQKDLYQLVKLPDLGPSALLRNYYNLAAVLIAANLPRNAQEILQAIAEKFPPQKQELNFKLLELVTVVETNAREDALVLIQRMKSSLRKQTNPRKLSYVRNFLELLQKLLEKKNPKFQEFHQMKTDWRTLFKPNLWMKAKIENYFYYNYILEFWQKQKKVINF